MHPKGCLVSTKVPFVTIFIGFFETKMWVYDSFRFVPEKKYSNIFYFASAETCFRDGLASFCIITRKWTNDFWRISAGIMVLLRKIAKVNLTLTE